MSFIIMCLSLSVFGQEITGKVTNIFGEPLISASIQWKGTQIGVVTDVEGLFTIKDLNDSKAVLVFSYLGFKSEQIKVGNIKHWEIQLIEDNTLNEIEITANGQATRFANDPAKIEVIGTREIERSACCSLAGCFSTNASVESATTNVITNAKELRILGLSGVYNQLLLDGMPLLQGLSYTYGTGSIPGTMIEQIYVAKGSNSVLQGFESISGQINIIPKSPENAEKILLNGFVNSFGESQYNANYLHKKSSWSNFTAAHLTLPAADVDGDEDGFQDIAKVKRVSIYNKWIYNNPDNQKVRSQIGLRFWSEDRVGGQVGYDKERDRGSNSIYGQTASLSQIDLYTKLNYRLKDNLSLVWLNSGFYHDQNSIFGQKEYDAQQLNIYSNVMLDYNFGSNAHNFKTGLSLRFNEMSEDISFIENPLGLSYEGKYINDYSVPGIFAEGTFYWDRFTFITGVRSDYHGKFGWKLTPRFLVRSELADDLDIRFSIGKGFRRVNLFAEQINLLSSNRDIIFEDELAPEEAVNIGLNIVKKLRFGEVSSTISVDGYLTYFQNQVFPDYDSEVGKAFVNNYYKDSKARSIQVENKWTFTEHVDFKWAYNFIRSTREVEGETKKLPFVPEHKVLTNMSYSTTDNAWQADVTYRWEGSKRLPDTQQYPEVYQQAEFSPSFSMVDFQITKRWTSLEIYTGIENLLDFRQDHPILGSDDPFGPYFDTAFNWGPTKGREFYLGLRYRVK